MVERMMGVLRLDSGTFEEIENDQNATTQAMIVVVLAAIAAGIGQLGQDDAALGLFGGIVAGIVGWAVYTAVITFVGTKLLATDRTSADWGQLARVIGFAYTPNLLAVLGFIPVLGAIAVLIGGIWTLIASVIGIRQALEASTGRAIGVIVIAFIIYVIVAGIILAIFGVGF